MKKVEIFTDGACRGNPGPGGWGVLLRYNGVEKRLHGGVEDTTNNRMELLAAIKAFEALKEPCEVILSTDSKYLMMGITEWMEKWRKNGWRTAAKKPVKNVELWEQLSSQIQNHQISWQWVKGHSGHEENEIADQLANQGIDELGEL